MDKIDCANLKFRNTLMPISNVNLKVAFLEVIQQPGSCNTIQSFQLKIKVTKICLKTPTMNRNVIVKAERQMLGTPIIGKLYQVKDYLRDTERCSKQECD